MFVKRQLTDEQVEAGLRAARESGGTLIKTGSWFWLEFESKPSQEVRDSLKGSSWKWSHKKAKWYLPVTHSASKGVSWEYIVDKYGEDVLQAA